MQSFWGFGTAAGTTVWQKKHALNVPRTKAGIHNVIVYCKANSAKTVIQAVDLMVKEEKK